MTGTGEDRYAERWWHFGIHWPCGVRYSDWFITKVNREWRRYCYPCWKRTRARQARSAE